MCARRERGSEWEREKSLANTRPKTIHAKTHVVSILGAIRAVDVCVSAMAQRFMYLCLRLMSMDYTDTHVVIAIYFLFVAQCRLNFTGEYLEIAYLIWVSVNGVRCLGRRDGAIRLLKGRNALECCNNARATHAHNFCHSFWLCSRTKLGCAKIPRGRILIDSREESEFYQLCPV